MLILYFVRHGEYDGNIQKDRLCGRSDLRPLNPVGISQVKNILHCFEDAHIDKIYSSPVPRAYETAEIIAKKLKRKIFIEEKIAEINYGEIEGKKFTEIHAYFKKKFKNFDFKKFDRLNSKLPNGESFSELFDRVKLFYDGIVKENTTDSKSYIIVTHQAAIHAIINILNQEDRLAIFDNYQEKYPIPNASITEIVIDNENQVDIKYIGKTKSPPPKPVERWLLNKFIHCTNFYQYPTFSENCVVSFDIENSALNAKFYHKKYEVLAEKMKYINDYLVDTKVPVKEYVHVYFTEIKTHPKVAISPHLVSDIKSNYSYAQNKQLAKSAAEVLKNLHTTTWEPNMSQYLYDPQYTVKVNSLQTWKENIQSIILIRKQESTLARKNDFLSPILDTLNNWFLSNFQTLNKESITILHGDYYPNNMYIKDNKVMAIYDFDWSAIGHSMWDLGITRERAEYYHYGGFSDHLEKYYGVTNSEQKWIYFYTLLEFIGSYCNDVIQKSSQQKLEKNMIDKYIKLLLQ